MKRAIAAVASLLAALLPGAQTAPEVEITNETHHHLKFENELIRVFQVEVAPHESTLMHWHRHDYIFVILGASHVSNEVKGKPPAEIKLQDGETGFSPAAFAHIARNLGPTPFRNMAIELMQDEKARAASPAKWDEERGLHVLPGGTREILFAKDGARVSEVELQPGGTIPSHHHNGPYLLVAVTDLDVRSDIEGQGPMPSHLKSGEVKWLSGGYTRSLTNIGKQPAKFVILEFP